MTPITSFDGEYRFLSNFYPAVVSYRGYAYPTVEHAYQAAKINDLGRQQGWEASIRTAPYPSAAKRQGRMLPPSVLLPDFELRKLGIMEGLVRAKFQHPALATLLLATGRAILIEGNWWGDTFWGVCNGVGENNLGRILMKVRTELQLIAR